MSHRISLCICTMNRPDDLRKCLASVQASRERPHETLVSDDSRQEIAPRVRAVTAEFPGVTYIPGPRRGLSANRNNCTAAASGDLVAFIDDDVVLHPDFLQRGAEAYDRARAEHRTDKIVLTGHEVRPDGLGLPSNLNFLGFYTGRLPDSGGPNAICINSTLFPSALFRLAEFDENFFFGSEETDISFHALHLGYRIVYSGDLINYHYPSSVNRDLYDKVILKSRLYFSLKRYWIYERSLPRFVLFNVYSLANAVGHCLKQLRIREAIAAVGAYFAAWGMFRSKLRALQSRT